MRRSACLLAQTFVLSCLSLGLLGTSDDGGCFGPKPPQDFCKETGGTWGPGDFWPAKCGDDPLDTKGPPVAKPGDSVCACPADKPNWTDGVGCRKCETPREICSRTGGTWGEGAFWPTKCGDDPLEAKGPAALPGQKVCACPADRPNWTDGTGCQKCDTPREICSRTGGTWGPGAFWPTKCGDDPLETKGPAALPGQKVCACPSDKPNWTDGTGCQKCDTPREICGRTGGTWSVGAYWPTKCGDDPLETKGPAASPGQKVCACPADKPNWTDGTGCQKCDTVREICGRTGGTWGHYGYWPTICGDDPALFVGRPARSGEKVCRCPFNAPNWTDGVGCRFCQVVVKGDCSGSATTCSYFKSSERDCAYQQGCYFTRGEWRRRTSYASSSGSCCKVCTTGKACGDSCISALYTCTKPPGCACDADTSNDYDNPYDTGDDSSYDPYDPDSDNDYDSGDDSVYNPYDPSGDDSSYDPYDPYDPYGSGSDSSDNYDPYDDSNTGTDSYYYTGDSCNGWATSCSSLHSQASCQAQSGCSWSILGSPGATLRSSCGGC